MKKIKGVIRLKGRYTTVVNYAKSVRITHQTAVNRLEAGKIKGVRMGKRAWLVQI
jgi:hypothetical protein